MKREREEMKKNDRGTELNLTLFLGLSTFRLRILSLLFISFCMASLKVLFLVLFCLVCTLLLLVPSSLNLLFIIICMLMTLSSSFLSLLPNSFKMFLILKTQLLTSLHGCLLIVLCLILLKLNSCFSVFLNSFPKLITLLCLWLLMSPYLLFHLLAI